MTTIKHKGVDNNILRFTQQFDDESVLDTRVLIQFILDMCADVDSSFSLKVVILLRHRCYESLLDCQVDPRNYVDSNEYYCDAAILGMIKKYPNWAISIDPTTEAKRTFIKCELACYATNQRFSNGVKPPLVNSIFAIAQGKIASILGECPSVGELGFCFGPGATYSVKKNTDALTKLSSNADVTPNCYGLAEKFLQSCPGWTHNDETYHEGPPKPVQLHMALGDRLSFVPKTAKTDRPIGIGPLLNGLIQKAIGSAIRDRLKPTLNLNLTQEKHRLLARRASKDSTLATIDLQSASDTISYMVILDLLPLSWFELMSQARATRYTIDDKWYSYQKFSAMGNGFTFELESLLFYSIAFACCSHLGLDVKEVSVYGDDIIVPAAAVSLLREVLSYSGFTVNEEKSFDTGQFRESCGGDYMNGTDVRPFILKDGLSFRVLFLLRNHHMRYDAGGNFPRLMKRIDQILGRNVLRFYSSHRSDDDFSLYAPSRPVGSYNMVVARCVRTKVNRNNGLFGKAYSLYKMINYHPGYVERALDSEVYERRSLRYKYKTGRCLHI